MYKIYNCEQITKHKYINKTEKITVETEKIVEN